MSEARDFVPVLNGDAWQLSERDAKNAVGWLEKHHDRPCLLCGGARYVVHPVVYTPILFNVVPRSQPCIPLLPRSCQCCGHVEFFSAVVALTQE